MNISGLFQTDLFGTTTNIEFCFSQNPKNQFVTKKAKWKQSSRKNAC